MSDWEYTVSNCSLCANLMRPAERVMSIIQPFPCWQCHVYDNVKEKKTILMSMKDNVKVESFTLP
jgi:hypothetical protein